MSPELQETEYKRPFKDTVLYTLLFVSAVCIVSSVLVATSAVTLKDRQEANKLLNRQKNVLDVAELVDPDEGRLTRDDVNDRFREHVRPIAVDLVTGAVAEDVDAATFDQRSATQDPVSSRAVSRNRAGLSRLANVAVVYHILGTDDSGTVIEDEIESIILPIEGKGLWSTLYGFIALTADLRTVTGITFYEHAETPGLGGEVDNARWKARWRGRQAFDENWQPKLQVIKGAAASPDVSPYEVDGLSGATLTGRGVSELVQFWLGADGFGPYLENYRRERGIS